MTSEGDFWRRQRRLAQPGFHRERIASFSHVMVDYTLRRIEGWQDDQLVPFLDDLPTPPRRRWRQMIAQLDAVVLQIGWRRRKGARWSSIPR